MDKVLVGAISPEAEYILNSYLSHFMPNAEVKPLKSVGIKGTIKREGSKADVALIIIDESLYNACKGVADDVLSLSKVHKYINDDGLKQFLISKFGVLEGLSSGNGVIAPENFVDAPDLPGLDSSYTGFAHVVKDDEDDFSVAYSEEQHDSSNKDSIISELRDKLATSETLVRNLTLQLQDSASAEDDSSIFVARIHELEIELEKKEQELRDASSNEYVDLGKIAKAEKVIEKVDSLEAQVRTLGEEKSALEYEKTKLESKVSILDEQIEDLKDRNAEIQPLRDEIESKSAEILELEKSIEQLNNSAIKSKNEISSRDSEIKVLQDKINELSGVADKLSESTDKNTKKELEITELRAEIETKVAEIKRRDDSISDLNAQIDMLHEQISQTEEKLGVAKSSNDDSAKIIEDLNAQISELGTQIDKLNSDIELKISEISDLKLTVSELTEDSERLGHKDAEINMLQENINEQKALIDTLSKAVDEKDSEIANINNEKLILQDKVDLQSSEYDKILVEKGKLAQELDGSEERNTELESKVALLTSQLEESNGVVEQSKATIDDNNVKITKLEAQVDTLQESLISAKADEGSVKRLEAELLEERRKSARLESEVEVLRKNDDSSKSADLRLEIKRLKEELEQAKTSSADVIELNDLRVELSNARERIAGLELDLADQTNLVSDMDNSVFTRMSNLTMPKVAFDVGLGNVPQLDENFFCFASGNTESVTALYKVLKRMFIVNSGVRYLYIDLDSSTYMDSDFGIVRIVSPIDWLEGTKVFTNFVADTKFPNVKVMSMGYSYFNDLFLLEVDWEKRLEELKGFADVVIFNVGCLNNFVAKLLFNTFIRNYRSYIVTRSSPVILRSTILTVTGLIVRNSFKNVSVECVDFDTKSSTQMYQRLASKCDAQILKDTDVLDLKKGGS